ncbi:MAG: hypothetical protein AB9835_05935 [Eubacteriales bacterium]
MHKTDILMNKKWGVFTHYLYTCQNNPSHPASGGHVETSWNECVNNLDVKLLASQLADAGAGYFVFTLMQGTRYMCAPNAAYDEISGYKPGEACSLRDLPEELYAALSPYGIDLYLYYTGDGPHFDPIAGPRFGFVEPRQNVSMDFVERWSRVLAEYSTRYGSKVKGWWIDGCYTFFGYNEQLLKPLADAARAGNPDSLVSLNLGVEARVSPYTSLEDFTCGEMNDFTDIPDSRFINGEQWHTLAPLGKSADDSPWNAWNRPGIKRSADYISDYVRRVNDKGGVVTVDVLLKRDGSLDAEQLEVLKAIDKK